ncbi:MAG: DUF86 domain-containing protein [Candidatus Scalinduaceae bacterium]
MIDREFIVEKINLITRDLKRLGVFSDLSIDQISEDFINFAALKNILMVTIGRAIDINEHLIYELAGPDIEAPKTYRETFTILGDLDILPKDFGEDISRSAGLRNVIVHEYNDLNKVVIYKKVGDAISQYVKYCDYILKYLK